MIHRETQIHIAIVNWIKRCSPNTLVWHTPNGGLRPKREGAKLKALGVLPGVPDLTLLCDWPGPELFFLEVKAPGKYLEPEQKEFRDKVVLMGVPFEVVRSIDDVRKVFRDLRIPTREAMAGVQAA